LHLKKKKKCQQVGASTAKGNQIFDGKKLAINARI
jgi:hypothetical protein